MEFCPKCGSIILAKDKKFICAKCNFRPKGKVKIETSEKINKKDEVAVVKEGQDNTNPIVDMNCIKCKTKRCYFWTKQTRAGDESETKFYKCTNPGCSHTWRVYR